MKDINDQTELWDIRPGYKIFFTGTGRHICDFLLHNARIRGRIMQYKKIQEVKFVAEH